MSTKSSTEITYLGIMLKKNIFDNLDKVELENCGNFNKQISKSTVF